MKKELLTTELLENKNIEECIYNIRGQQVMLDSDIASFFGIEVRRINEQMKRNVSRFPEDFCFQINSIEFKTLRSQNATFNYSTRGRKFLPFVYTEHGIIALAGVLKSDVAAQMSVEIARKFIQMRRFIIENRDYVLALAKLQNRQLEFENETNRKFDEIIKRIDKLDLPKAALIYDGKLYDAYDHISSIIASADQRIILVDPFVDEKVFTYFKNMKPGVDVTIYKGPRSKLDKLVADKFRSQFGDIKVKKLDKVHDRFLIVDDECYSLGTSLNNAGRKLFAICKIENSGFMNSLLARAENQWIILKKRSNG